MAVTVASLMAKLGLDKSSFDKGLSGAGSSLGSFASRLGGGLLSATKTAAVALGGLGSTALGIGGYLVNLGSDAAEMQSKFDTVFGANAAGWANRFDLLADKVGRNRYELMNFGATIQGLLGPMGLTGNAAANMSMGFTELAVDLSSFYNATESDALNALRSALIGETEPMRQFGVVLNQAAIEAEALRMGLMQQGGELTAAAKAQATYSLIMQQTVAAQGDAVRTGGGWANQMRALQGALAETATTMGTQLLPVVTPLLQQLNTGLKDVLPKAGQIFTDFATKLQTNLGPALMSLQDSWNRIVTAFGGSPEQITPAQVILDSLKATLDALVIAIQAVAVAFEKVASAVEIASGLVNNFKTIVDTVGVTGLLSQLTGIGGGGGAAPQTATAPAATQTYIPATIQMDGRTVGQITGNYQGQAAANYGRMGGVPGI